VAGVELSEPLARVAVANAEKLGLRNVRIYVSDAADFTDLDRFTHVYMFNPFPSPVMRDVMANVAASLRRCPRRFSIIYFHPVCHDVLMGSGLFQKDAEIRFSCSLPYFTYVHAPRLAASIHGSAA
jgi:hypothetical protein